jgi:phytoene dehydrogenase-like protein
MPSRGAHDVVVVGSGPKGLAAAITCARAGRSVLVLEGAPTLGGGVRSAELTLPGIRPRHPLVLARFGARAWRSARGLAEGMFEFQGISNA